MFGTKLTILGRRIKVPAELVFEYKSVFGIASEAEMIAEIESGVKHKCTDYQDCSEQKIVAVVLDILRSSKQAKHAFDHEKFLDDLYKELAGNRKNG